MTAALLLAATLMQPADFTGRWSFTSFQTRPVSLRVTWTGADHGRTTRGLVSAFRVEGGPLVVESWGGYGRACLWYVVTHATRDHRHLKGIVELRDWPCVVVVKRGTFRAHQEAMMTKEQAQTIVDAAGLRVPLMRENGTVVSIIIAVTTPHPQLATAIDVLLRRAHRRR